MYCKGLSLDLEGSSFCECKSGFGLHDQLVTRAFLSKCYLCQMTLKEKATKRVTVLETDLNHKLISLSTKRATLSGKVKR